MSDQLRIKGSEIYSLDEQPSVWGRKEGLDMSDTIKEQLAAAIGARKGSLVALRARIIDLLEDVPVGVKLKLSDDGSVFVKVVRVFDTDQLTGSVEWGLIDQEGDLVGASQPNHDSSYVLGTKRDWEDERGDLPKLRWTSGKVTRAIALRLPEAIARYIAECEAEAKANESTAVTHSWVETTAS